ncbi:MAG: VOC family protein [Solirubrobacteraceae bacterium]
MAGEPSWFEIGSGDVAQGQTFYGALFGWTFEDAGAGGVIRTPGLPGGMHGGDAGGGPYLFFAVNDLEAAVERVKALGGEIEEAQGASGEPTPYGRFVMCRDDQGSAFGLHEPAAD